MNLSEVIGKRVKIVGNHPHTDEKGTIEGADNTPIGYGLTIRLDNGEGTMVFKRENFIFI